MKSRNVMDRGDYRLLPKGLRRMLVFSETFFFREYGKAKTPKKPRRRRFSRPPPRWLFASSSHTDHFWNANRTSELGLGANECVPDQGMWRKPTAFRQPCRQPPLRA